MLRRSIICLMAVGAVSALLTLSPPTAHAIPVAGDYVFTSGLVGTFTSNGNSLTSWTFYVPEINFTFTDTDERTALDRITNTSTNFFIQDVGINSGTWHLINIVWDDRYSASHAVNGTFEAVSGVESFTYAPATAVPEPTAMHLLGLGLGLLVLVEAVRRQRRPAGLQIG